MSNSVNATPTRQSLTVRIVPHSMPSGQDMIAFCQGYVRMNADDPHS